MAVNYLFINLNRNMYENKKMKQCSGYKEQLNLVFSFLFCVFLYSEVCVSLTYASGLTNCTSVKVGFHNRGIAASDVPVQPLNAQHLRVCEGSQGLTCCSPQIEAKLAMHSRQQLDQSLKDSLTKLASILNTRSQRFDDFFRKLLTDSKREFHEMFKKTYGMIYVQNAYLFTDLYQELESYYTRGRVDLANVMDEFFSLLYQRMFTVLNSQYSFDDKYLACVSDHMKELKPFGDVPHKLSIQVKRSFVATRTFARALAISAEVVKSMLNIKPSPECAHAVLKMQHCAECSGHSLAKACSHYCINVMKGCLAYHAELDTEWNNFVEAMEKVSDRLLGPFNIEMVVEPIDIKISEAIMNFQDNGIDVSKRVFSGCGKPELGRVRRSVNLLQLKRNYTDSLIRNKREKQQSADEDLQFETTEEKNADRERRGSMNHELEFETLKFGDDTASADNVYDKGMEDESDKDRDDPLLDKLVKDIRQKVRDSKHFWSHMPYQFCNNDNLATVPEDINCWNGTTIGKYTPEVAGNGLAAQRTNPSVVVDITRPNSALNEQLYQLKEIVNKLKNAYNGMDVDWIDSEEPIYGSGSGSGDAPTDDEGGDDVEPDSNIGGSGHESVDVVYENNPSNEYHPPPDVPYDRPPHNAKNTTQSIDSGASIKQQMSLSRALATYLFPLVIVWFGGMFSEVL